MPPRKRTRKRDGAELRSEILAELRECLGAHAEPGGVWHDHFIAPLERGDEVQVQRYDLPDWHPERFAGQPHEPIWLDAVIPTCASPDTASQLP
ncbi:hypothetical protein [Mycobacteroides salmoniphilum]|uniref:hypothetical protein n=1 Tax=Mycobacteroides salmoniphilum TaxID=404941 RepID=UPI000993504D|nr:hypothetical protein [Mycobacteroides salmoniphilum]